MTRDFILRTDSDRRIFARRLCEIAAARPIRVSVRRYRPHRTLAQNRLLWLWTDRVRWWMWETGRGYCEPGESEPSRPFTADELHEYHKAMFLPSDTVIIDGQVVVCRSSHDKDVAVFSEFLDAIDGYWAMRGLVLPHPNDLYPEAMHPANSQASVGSIGTDEDATRSREGAPFSPDPTEKTAPSTAQVLDWAAITKKRAEIRERSARPQAGTGVLATKRADRRYLEVLGTMPCVCCFLLGRAQEGRTTVHHIRDGQGMSQRAADPLAIPLCADCHQGPNGIHGDRAYLRVLKCNEWDLLAVTVRQVMLEAGIGIA